ncbi:hypothetical protein SK128_001525, partial [Halocaridina rubra]
TTERGHTAISYWFKMYREMCSSTVSVNRDLMLETKENPILIRRRKYKRSWLLNGDREPKSADRFRRNFDGPR